MPLPQFATYLRKFALCAVALVLTGTTRAEPPAGAPGSIGDPNLLYVGRWEKPVNGIRNGYWSGVYLRTKFTGTSIGISLASPTLLSVSIDGESPREVNAAAGLTPLNTAALKPREHQLHVGSAGQNYEVAFQGLQLDPAAKTIPPVARPLIEYIGDSITQGNSSYAWRSAQMLGCDHVQIAFSGVALTNGFGCSTKVGMDAQYFSLKNFNHTKEPPSPWTFDYTPRIIVINLGQNDQCGKEPDATMTASYTSFVQRLREKFPQAHIVAMRTLGGPYAEAEKQAVEGLITAGDTRLHFADTTGWLAPDDFSDGIHPNSEGNLKAGWKLANILAPLLDEPR